MENKDQEQNKNEKKEFTVELSDKFCSHKGDFKLFDKDGNELVL